MFTEERLRGAARSWNARVGKTAEDGPALLGPNYTEVRYEELLERPNEEVGRLAGFLGADTSEKAVQQAVGSASFEKLSKGRERGRRIPPPSIVKALRVIGTISSPSATSRSTKRRRGNY